MAAGTAIVLLFLFCWPLPPALSYRLPLAKPVPSVGLCPLCCLCLTSELLPSTQLERRYVRHGDNRVLSGIHLKPPVDWWGSAQGGVSRLPKGTEQLWVSPSFLILIAQEVGRPSWRGAQIFFFLIFILNRRIIALQCCVGVCCPTVSYKYTYILSLWASSHPPASHLLRSSQSTELSSLCYKLLPTGCLFYTW